MSRRIAELIDEYEPGGVSPCFRVHQPNQAEHREGMIDAETAVYRQCDVGATCEMDHDPSYVLNPLAIYHVLAGELADALEILDELDGKLTRDCIDSELLILRHEPLTDSEADEDQRYTRRLPT